MVWLGNRNQRGGVHAEKNKEGCWLVIRDGGRVRRFPIAQALFDQLDADAHKGPLAGRFCHQGERMVAEIRDPGTSEDRVQELNRAMTEHAMHCEVCQ